MSQPRSRWFLNIVLVLGAVAFVGFSMLPLFENVIKESQPTTVATPTMSQTPMAELKSKLAGEARGYEVVLQQEPNNQIALQGLVNTRIQLGDLEGAIAPLEKLITLDPQDYRPVLVKATILKQQGKTAQAKALFEQAAALAPAEAKEKINQLATPQPAASTPSPVPKGDKGTR